MTFGEIRIPIKASRSEDYRPPPARFVGMDFFEEPPPYPPAFVREWERRLAPPRSSFVSMFDQVMREAWGDTRRIFRLSDLLFGGAPYETPPAQQARYELRQAQRKARA